MNSPIKFLFLPTIAVIFLLTLPDTRMLLAALLPPQLPWAISAQRERSAEPGNHTAAHQHQPLRSRLPSHGAVSRQEQPVEVGRWACQKAEGADIARSRQRERPSRDRRETGESWEWPIAAELRELHGFPSCYCFGLFCPQLHTSLCKCSSKGSSPLDYLATWSTENELNIFTLTCPSFQ